MNMQQGNVFNKNKFTSKKIINRGNSFKKNFFDCSHEEIEIDEALKSVNLPSHMFCNFFKGKKDFMFKFVKKQYKAMSGEKYNILDYFELKNVEFKANLSEKKINDIVVSTYGQQIQFETLYRFKSTANPAFQLYVNKENNHKYKVIIVDLYHLVIPAIDKFKDRKTVELKKDYEAVKNYDYCLSNLKR